MIVSTYHFPPLPTCHFPPLPTSHFPVGNTMYRGRDFPASHISHPPFRGGWEIVGGGPGTRPTPYPPFGNTSHLPGSTGKTR
jgi:hypothetical protein